MYLRSTAMSERKIAETLIFSLKIIQASHRCQAALAFWVKPLDLLSSCKARKQTLAYISTQRLVNDISGLCCVEISRISIWHWKKHFKSNILPLLPRYVITLFGLRFVQLERRVQGWSRPMCRFLTSQHISYFSTYLKMWFPYFWAFSFS